MTTNCGKIHYVLSTENGLLYAAQISALCYICMLNMKHSICNNF